jgi:hypothetical protein
MANLEQLTDRVETLLHGYSLNTEASTWLTADATSSATTLSVYDASSIGKGYMQIGDEMVFVNNTDNVNNQVTLAPWGRGQRGSIAQAHSTNEKVVIAPLFPRYEIKKAINNTIDAMYPMIFAIGQYQFPYIAARTTYQIPTEVENIHNVTHSIIGPSKEWLPVRAWQLDRMANPTAFGDGTHLGHSLSILNPAPVPGRTVNVVYSKRPTLFDITNETTAQEYSTVTGLPSYSEDVVLYGAAFRMISFLDPSRLGPLSAEADILDNQRGAQSGANASRFLYNIYQTRLNEVADIQRRQFPIRSHYQR